MHIQAVGIVRLCQTSNENDCISEREERFHGKACKALTSPRDSPVSRLLLQCCR